ncbi:AMP-binding protein [Marinobacter sp. C2H3]|uniref:AMP-binding protein n=1 Tax=Marinobacter sp. C2H3 TaxID=3119003 RepID=UPI003FA55861
MASLPDELRAAARRTPERVALRDDRSSLTYRETLVAAEALAGELRARGLHRLGLCGDNALAWVLADLACLMAGVVCVPIPPFFSTGQTEHLITRAGLEGLLDSRVSGETPIDDGAEALGHGVSLVCLPAVSAAEGLPEGTAKITFTSGSTGTPKGVCLSEAQMAATALALRERLEGVAMAHHLCILPLATLLENIAGIYLPLLMGSTVTVLPLASLGMSGSSGLDLPRLIAGLNRVAPDSLILVPELALALVTAAEQGALMASSFRFLAVGGGRVSADLLARGRKAGLPLFEGYGLSECASVVALNVPGAERAGTVGRPLSHVEVRTDDDGHIRVRGNTFLGYLGEPPAAPGGWLDTGDLGALDGDGFLAVQGRAKNLIITGFGRNISPEWLESELVQRLGARQAVVYGDGEVHPRALLVIPDSRGPDALLAALDGLNHTLPDYARLEVVHVRREPLTAADGYMTANGRPRRQRIQDDLPDLLAGAQALFCRHPKADSSTPSKTVNNTATNADTSHPTCTPGDTHGLF